MRAGLQAYPWRAKEIVGRAARVLHEPGSKLAQRAAAMTILADYPRLALTALEALPEGEDHRSRACIAATVRQLRKKILLDEPGVNR